MGGSDTGITIITLLLEERVRMVPALINDDRQFQSVGMNNYMYYLDGHVPRAQGRLGRFRLGEIETAPPKLHRISYAYDILLVLYTEPPMQTINDMT